MRLRPFLPAVALLVAAAPTGSPRTLDTRWTQAASKAFVARTESGKLEKSLPEIRVYDAGDRLVLRSFGAKNGPIGRSIVQALRRHSPIAGPSFKETLAELETRDGKPALGQTKGGARITVVDYWAEWCIPCKALGKELDAWAARQPAGYVQIVRAETDPMAAMQASGIKMKRFKKGPDGKLVEVQ